MFPGVKTDSKLYLDRYGMAISLACAVHCAVVPLAATFLVGTGLSWLAGRELEWTVLFSTVILGSTRLFQSFLKHRKAEALAIFVAGLAAFWAAKAALFPFAYSEAWFMALGGILVAVAHFRNLKLCTCCAHRH
jgi:hypothetical protein